MHNSCLKGVSCCVREGCRKVFGCAWLWLLQRKLMYQLRHSARSIWREDYHKAAAVQLRNC